MKTTVYYRQGLRVLEAINFSFVYIQPQRWGMTCESARYLGSSALAVNLNLIGRFVMPGSTGTLSNLNQAQTRRRYVNFENGSHFICSLNLNNPESTVFITFKMNDISSENQEFVNSLISNTNRKINAKFITFYKICCGPGLLISKAHRSTYVAMANDSSSLIPKPDIKFPASKSNCTDLNKWHVSSVTWSNKGENLSNCSSNGEKLINIYRTGNVKGSDCCYIGDFGKMPGLKKTYLTGCIGEIISFYKTLNDQETSYFHKYLMKKWGITDTIVSY